MFVNPIILFIYEILLDVALFFTTFNFLFTQNKPVLKRIFVSISVPVVWIFSMIIHDLFYATDIVALLYGLVLYGIFFSLKRINFEVLNSILLLVYTKGIIEFLVALPINTLKYYNLHNHILVMITTKILTFIVSIAIYKKIYPYFTSNIDQVKAKKIVTYSLLILNILFSSYFIFIQWFDLYRKLLYFTLTITIIFVIITVGFLYALHKYLQLKFQHELSNQHLEALTKYNHIVEEETYKTKEFQHDYKNLMLSTTSFIENNDLAGLKEMMHSLIDYSKDYFSHSTFQYKDIHNIKHPALKSIILAKLVTFTELGITCQFECRKPLDNIYIDTFDFIRVVGILLDNAQEYVTTIEEKHIEILITSHTKMMELVISNPYIPDHYTLRNFKQEGFSLKGNDRGMGLSTITKIEKKHDNLTVLFEKNTIFSAKIITTKL
ncbi:hypothetical protein B8A42_04005 [Dolosigranulum pigrum]|uniref:GHKL domain-containing protein n=1 Tax=Dolosigranulum pigrum TaxID=29394 RepID=UPI000DC02E8B|nr:GHKL domain-containing protein [Dolosigranulum pigrum]QTJ45246.1 GHKL domain-containing protein [Dolosigranulum pigrum]RAN55308.1 hypothetical protein B8A42_04005 [Dolosigranulum pigrum]